MKVLSDAAEYALRAVVWLARHEDRPHTIDRIARGTRATPGYLARVLQLLGRAGVVRGKRGVAGGFVLSRQPSGLTVLEIINAVDPFERMTRCPLDMSEHQDELCALHARLDQAIAQLLGAFGKLTIAQIVSDRPARSASCELTTLAKEDGLQEIAEEIET